MAVAILDVTKESDGYKLIITDELGDNETKVSIDEKDALMLEKKMESFYDGD